MTRKVTQQARNNSQRKVFDGTRLNVLSEAEIARVKQQSRLRPPGQFVTLTGSKELRALAEHEFEAAPKDGGAP
jgi:hypothetical protein